MRRKLTLANRDQLYARYARRARQVKAAVVGYALLHIGVIAFWHLFPIVDETVHGTRYVVTRAWTGPVDLIPFVGLSPLLGTHFTMLITTADGGKRSEWFSELVEARAIPR